MKTGKIIKTGFFKYFALCLFLVSETTYSQGLTNFSGKWILDLKNSKNLVGMESSTLNIYQTDTTIIIDFSMKSNNSQSMNWTEKYFFGKGIINDKSFDSDISIINPNSFSISQVASARINGSMTIFNKVFVYTLSDNGNTLTIKADDILSDGTFITDKKRHTISIYNKLL
jgi:hypothetical protein